MFLRGHSRDIDLKQGEILDKVWDNQMGEVGNFISCR